MRTPKIVIPLADGVEEMEAVIIIDTLRRAKLDVISAAVGNSKTIRASRGVVLVADTMWSEITPIDYDAIILPGGAVGTDNLIKCATLIQALKDFDQHGKLIGAVCAGLLAVQAAGILSKPITCHPAVSDKLTSVERSNERVVESENLITSQGPGTSFEFALVIIAKLTDNNTADAVATGLIL